MSIQEIHNGYAYLRALSPVTQTNASTALVSEIIDLSLYKGVEFVIQTGAVTDADVTVATTIHHGDAANLSDAALVPDVDLLGTESGASFAFGDDNSVFTLGYKKAKRYVRVTLTPTGNNSGNLPVAIVAVCEKMIQGESDNPSA